MSKIKSKNTKIETILCKALWSRGIRYRKNDRSVFGCPDIVFKRKKIAVFCDSEFFHGKDWPANKYRLNSNKEFWIAKIERNIKRDVEVNERLENEGWLVLRFWGEDIKKNQSHCVEVILNALNER